MEMQVKQFNQHHQCNEVELKYNAFRILNGIFNGRSGHPGGYLNGFNLSHSDGTLRNLCSGSNVTKMHSDEYTRIVTNRYNRVHALMQSGKDSVYSWWNSSDARDSSKIGLAYMRSHFNDVTTSPPSTSTLTDQGAHPAVEVTFVHPIDMISNSTSSGLYYFSDGFASQDRYCVRMSGTLSECYSSDVTSPTTGATAAIPNGRSTSMFCPVNTHGADPGRIHVAELLYQCVHSRHNTSVKVYLDRKESFGYSIPTRASTLYDSDSGTTMTDAPTHTPVVSGSSPSSGPLTGGTTITYTGTGLTGIKYCLFIMSTGNSHGRYSPVGSKYRFAVDATSVTDNRYAPGSYPLFSLLIIIVISSQY